VEREIIIIIPEIINSFDICQDSGASAAFFPSGRGALTGNFTEVSCKEWSGSDGHPEWKGACHAGESVATWPAVGRCGNQGTLFVFAGLLFFESLC
jgi:hypothetical protein